MTKVNSVERTSQEPLKKALTKAGAETRPVHDAVLPAGAAGQTTISLLAFECHLVHF